MIERYLMSNKRILGFHQYSWVSVFTNFLEKYNVLMYVMLYYKKLHFNENLISWINSNNKINKKLVFH